MLKKLLKYDLKNVYKVLIIFYALSIFFGVLTRIFFSIDNSTIMNIIAQVCGGITISMVFNILINNLIKMWVTFKQNLYGDESYLTHTLPVEKTTLYLAKIITTFITLFTSVLVIGLSLFIAYYSKENIELIKTLLTPVANAYNSTIIGMLAMLLFILFLEFANLLQSGFTGIILGHKMNSAKTGYSILFGFIAYMVTQLFVLLLLFVMALFNKDIMNLFYTTEIVNIDVLKLLIYVASGIYMVTLVIGYIINVKLFKKGINVD